MIEGSSVQEHGVKMLSFMEKLKDLKADLEKETYIGVILQSLSPSFDPFIIKYNMNRLDKDLHELINMLVQYKATIEKSVPLVFAREASTLEAKGEGAERRMRKKGKTNLAIASAQSALVAPLGMGKGKRKAVRQSRIPKDIFIYCREKGIGRGSALNSSPIKVHFVIEP
ncbi:UNVERIFIED_CONTAM: hypothetical protein Scaly_2432800 [Sesamum calycinum]|uniref:Zinc finger, CCHC-type n=1 Tax=Sesamum calycinum TaxID=2727403 RepID=A0AAW2M2R4_9LAMI